MPYVFQTERKDGTAHSKWRFQYTDWTGRRRTATGTTSKRETEKIARRVQDKHDRIKKGLEPPPDSAQKHRTQPFNKVKKEYLDWGESQGGRGGKPWGEKHARMRQTHLNWWEEQLELNVLADLEGILPEVEAALRNLKDMGRSNKTINNYAGALRAFCNWCIERSYLSENPIEDLGQWDTTPEQERRALTRKEVRLLLEHSPPERELTYKVALCSGLRAKELRNLQVRHLDLDRGGLHLDESWTKNRKPGFQPLPGFLLDELRHEVEDKEPTESLLYVPSHPARAMDKDLETARILKQTEEGKIDFHALRVTFVSLLVESGASVKETQALARHANPDLTMNVYAKTRSEHLQRTAEGIGRTLLGEDGNTIRTQREGEAEQRPSASTSSGDTYDKKDWWRRRESNPRPWPLQLEYLRA